MAKPSTGHRAPRQQAAATTARRVTRSQSAEPRELSPASLARWRPVQAAAAADAPSTISRSGLPRGGEAATNLSAVEENNESDDDENDAQNDDGEVDFEMADRSRDDSNLRASVGSGFSGTTAKTSFSQEEIQELDAETMIDLIPDLESAALALGTMLAPSGSDTSSDVWKEIRRGGSRQNKLWESRLASFLLHKPNFGTEEYLQPRIIIRAMLGVRTMEEVPAAVWRPDNILLNINLVQMLNSLLIFCDPSAWTASGADALERLNVAFPQAIAGGQFDMASMEFYLNLAAQLAIARLEAHLQSEPQFAPFKVIHDVLYDDHDSDDDEDDSGSIRNSAFRYSAGLGLDDVDEADRRQALAMVSQLEQELKQAFGKSGNASRVVAIRKLKDKFQWAHFMDHTLRYFASRKKLLDDRIDAAGGVGRILEGLSRELERRAALKASGQPVDKYARQRSRISIPALKDLEKRLLAMPPGLADESATPQRDMSAAHNIEQTAKQQALQQQSVQTAPPQVIPQANMTLQDDDILPLEDQADESRNNSEAPEPDTSQRNLPTSSLQAISALQRGQRLAKQKVKTKSLLDRQEGAVRVSFDDSQQTQTQQQRQSPVVVSPSRVSRKRPYVEEDDDEEDQEPEAFDPTPDEGFQTDIRKTAAADQRRKELSSSDPLSSVYGRQSYANKSSLSNPPASASASNSAPAAPAAPAAARSPKVYRVVAERVPKRPRQNPGSAIPVHTDSAADNGAEPPQSTAFTDVKRFVKQNRAGRAKPMQERSAWSEEEEAALLELIIQHGDEGISYAMLKQIDGINGPLQNRDAEAMRFKARNMKQTFLEARVGLPDNWDKVILDKKARDKLESLGIDYHQERVRATSKKS